MDTLFIFGAKYLMVFALLIGTAFFFIQSRDTQKRMLLFAITAGILALLTALVAGYLYTDPRPFVIGNFLPLIPHAADNGFPSDHTLMTALAAAVVYPFNRRVSVILWLITVLVGISRVYVGVHHPIDIIGSMLIGIGTTTIAHIGLQRYAYKKLA